MNTHRIELNSAPQYWHEGFPIGTGRLAAMVSSCPGSDILYLNHEALWTNLGKHRTLSDFTAFLPEFRRLLAEHRSDDATEFLVAHSKTLDGIPGHSQNPFVSAGEIEFRYFLPEKEQSFRRSLDLANGSSEACSAGLTRSFWGNPGKDLLEGSISSENAVSADLILSRRAVNMEWGDSQPRFSFQDGLMKFTGSVPGNVFYCICVRLAGEYEAEDFENGLHLKNVKRLSFRCNAGCGNTVEDAENEANLQKFDLASFQTDQERRNAGYRKTYDSLASLETPSGGEVIRYFNFAKHLLLNGTTTGSYPLNLQGKWNADPQPAWDSDYHMDINLQMNYWPVLPFGLERANLSCLTFLEGIIPGAREAAKRMFGCRGLWFPYTADPTFRPHGAGIWGISAGCIPWLAAHYFQHYLYTQDMDFLRDHCFPFLREAILFFEDFITYRADGTACLSPSMSPENCFAGAQKYPVALCENATMDVELVDELLTNGIAASELLGENEEERVRWQKMKDALPPLKIGKDGRLLEWETEVEEVEPGHRHVSHLYAVWPGNAINPDQTPELFEAARKSLDFRLRSGGGHTGWSRAWCANFKAMFGDGNGALEELKTQVAKQSSVSLLDLHPINRKENGWVVFQIDGNFGAAAAVFNMLLQNAPDNGIKLLPALPDEWRAEGRASGICAVGALRFDFSWKDGKIVSLTIHSKTERHLHLTYNGQTRDLRLHPGCNPVDHA